MDQGDQELLSLLASDLDGHFRLLVEVYQQRLYLFALRLAGRPDDAEDIVQEAFLRAYYALKGTPTRKVRILNLWKWLITIILNIFRNRARKRELQVISLDLPENSTARDIADQVLGPDEEAYWHEWRYELAGHIASLPEHYRPAITLYLFEELSYAEIAELLQQPIGTVKAYISRAKHLLRQLGVSIPNPANCTVRIVSRDVKWSFSPGAWEAERVFPIPSPLAWLGGPLERGQQPGAC